MDEKSDSAASSRLTTWTTSAVGDYAEWCVQGARDGVDFYKAHKGDNACLKQAFRWDWLKSYFIELYSNVDFPDLDVLQHRQSQWQH